MTGCQVTTQKVLGQLKVTVKWASGQSKRFFNLQIACTGKYEQLDQSIEYVFHLKRVPTDVLHVSLAEKPNLGGLGFSKVPYLAVGEHY